MEINLVLIVEAMSDRQKKMFDQDQAIVKTKWNLICFRLNQRKEYGIRGLIIIILSWHQHGYPWTSLATPPKV